jgi:hypothetical protein
MPDNHTSLRPHRQAVVLTHDFRSPTPSTETAVEPTDVMFAADEVAAPAATSLDRFPHG